MTRTRKNEDAKHTRRLIVRLTDEDQARIRANAQKAGLRLSEYVRRVAVDGQVVVRRETAYGMSLAFQLRKIGVNLNQLARAANSNGEIPPELAQLCGRMEILLDSVVEMK
jgi:hypothetical protein